MSFALLEWFTIMFRWLIILCIISL